MPTPTLESLTIWLEREYRHWDYLYEFGGQDPFFEDGVNLDLTRNHIISIKRDIDEFMSREQEEPTLFTSTYPAIYYRELPPELPYDYMARPNEIRARAVEQLALYEQDPNFCYIRDHHYELFPDGQQTRAAKEAGFYPTQSGSVMSYRKALENDNLVDLRRMFYESYEKKAERWSELAQKMKDYLSKDHSKDDMAPVKDFYEDEECPDDLCDVEEDLSDKEQMPDKVAGSKRPQKLSLDEQIRNAADRADAQMKGASTREEQITLF